MTRRHRFKGSLGRACSHLFGSEITARACGLNYSNPHHWHDDDHPHIPGDLGFGCGWRLQAGSRPTCNLGFDHEVHHRPQEEMTVKVSWTGDVPEETQVLRVDRPVYDAAPDEGLRTSGGGEGSAADLTEVFAVEVTPGMQAAEAYVAGREVRDGPWPVRQFSWKESSGAVASLLDALKATGDAFEMHVWWVDVQTQMVRVQWGEFLYNPQDVVAGRLRAWEK